MSFLEINNFANKPKLIDYKNIVSAYQFAHTKKT